MTFLLKIRALFADKFKSPKIASAFFLEVRSLSIGTPNSIKFFTALIIEIVMSCSVSSSLQ